MNITVLYFMCNTHNDHKSQNKVQTKLKSPQPAWLRGFRGSAKIRSVRSMILVGVWFFTRITALSAKKEGGNMTMSLSALTTLLTLLFLLSGLLFTVLIDPYIQRKHRFVMIIIVVLCFTLMLSTEKRLWC